MKTQYKTKRYSGLQAGIVDRNEKTKGSTHLIEHIGHFQALTPSFITKIYFVLIICVMVVSALSPFAFADPLDSIQIIQISSQDERAVIKTRDGGLKVINVGDSIGQNGKITEITKGRVVIEEETADGLEKVIIRVGDGKQNIERIKKVADKPPLLYKPQADTKE